MLLGNITGDWLYLYNITIFQVVNRSNGDIAECVFWNFTLNSKFKGLDPSTMTYEPSHHRVTIHYYIQMELGAGPVRVAFRTWKGVPAL